MSTGTHNGQLHVHVLKIYRTIDCLDKQYRATIQTQPIASLTVPYRTTLTGIASDHKEPTHIKFHMIYSNN